MRRRYLYWLLLGLMVLTGIIVLWFQPWRVNNLSTIGDVKAMVSRHYTLPIEEEPALLTVLDANKLSSVYLKTYAKTGDKILIYKNYQRTIIYRPSIDRIIDVGPVIIDNPKVSNE